MLGVLDIPITPEQILRWFGSFSVVWQIMIAAGGSLVAGLVIGWLARRSWDRDSVTHWRDLVAEYKSKMQTLSEGSTSAIGHSQKLLDTLKETTPEGKEIVGDLRRELREIRDTVKTFSGSTALLAQVRPVTLTRAQKISVRIVLGLVSVVVAALIMLLGFVVKQAYNQFPDPLSPSQMSDLAERLRNEGPQKIMVIRKEDEKSIALAEQFRQIFESAHWVLVTPPRPPRNGATLPRGLVIWRAPNDNRALALARALYISGLLYLTQTDTDLTDSGYSELSISDGWLGPSPPQ